MDERSGGLTTRRGINSKLQRKKKSTESSVLPVFHPSWAYEVWTKQGEGKSCPFRSVMILLLEKLPVVPLRLIGFHLFDPSGGSFGAKRHASQAAVALDKKAYSHTLLLPKPSIPTRQPNPAENERRLRGRTSDELYRWQVCRVTRRQSSSAAAKEYLIGSEQPWRALRPS